MYLRQYFYAVDRDEMQFDRATRAWISRTAHGEHGIVGFGSTYDVREPGSFLFVNASSRRWRSCASQPRCSRSAKAIVKSHLSRDPS